jgi:phosphatidylglycerol:prolipoprotein diacylglycerol transferase
VTIAGFTVESFGALVATGVIIGMLIGDKMFREVGYSREYCWSLGAWGLIGGVVGSKLWFVCERIARGDTADVLTLLTARGGVTFYGGLFLGVSLLYICARSYKVSMWHTMHLVAVPMMVAQSIGRIGCFLAGDDYGRPTDLPWGFAFPDGAPPTLARVHPTMLYESAWLALGAIVLWRRRHTSPFLFAEYLVVAGVGRFATEMLRINPPLLGPLSNAQVIALGSCVVGITLWVWTHSRGGIGMPAPAQTAEQPLAAAGKGSARARAHG